MNLSFEEDLVDNALLLPDLFYLIEETGAV